MKKQIVFALVVALTGCSTLRKSVLAGAGGGAVTGGVIGGMTSHGDANGVALGVVSGALLGSLIGYVSHKKSETSTSLTQSTQVEEKQKVPSFIAPKVKTLWIPDKIDGNKYIRGHEVYILDQPASWQKE